MNVVLIDDDSEDLALVTEAFEFQNSFDKIIGFTEGEVALQYLKSHNDLSIVVTDLRMPVVSGFNVLEEIKSNSHLLNLMVIVLTTSSNPADKEKCKKLGANAYFTKPDSFKELINISSQIVALARH